MHGIAALIFRTLYSWLYEVFARVEFLFQVLLQIGMLFRVGTLNMYYVTFIIYKKQH